MRTTLNNHSQSISAILTDALQVHQLFDALNQTTYQYIGAYMNSTGFLSDTITAHREEYLGKIQTLQTDIKAVNQTSTSQVSGLYKYIGDVITQITQAFVTGDNTALASEKSYIDNRETSIRSDFAAADSLNAQSISTEKSARESATSNLREALTQEQTNRSNADSALGVRVTKTEVDISDLNTKVDSIHFPEPPVSNDDDKPPVIYQVTTTTQINNYDQSVAVTNTIGGQIQAILALPGPVMQTFLMGSSISGLATFLGSAALVFLAIRQAAKYGIITETVYKKTFDILNTLETPVWPATKVIDSGQELARIVAKYGIIEDLTHEKTVKLLDDLKVSLRHLENMTRSEHMRSSIGQNPAHKLFPLLVASRELSEGSILTLVSDFNSCHNPQNKKEVKFINDKLKLEKSIQKVAAKIFLGYVVETNLVKRTEAEELALAYLEGSKTHDIWAAISAIAGIILQPKFEPLLKGIEKKNAEGLIVFYKKEKWIVTADTREGHSNTITLSAKKGSAQILIQIGDDNAVTVNSSPVNDPEHTLFLRRASDPFFESKTTTPWDQPSSKEEAWQSALERIREHFEGQPINRAQNSLLNISSARPSNLYSIIDIDKQLAIAHYKREFITQTKVDKKTLFTAYLDQKFHFPLVVINNADIMIEDVKKAETQHLKEALRQSVIELEAISRKFSQNYKQQHYDVSLSFSDSLPSILSWDSDSDPEDDNPNKKIAKAIKKYYLDYLRTGIDIPLFPFKATETFTPIKESTDRFTPKYIKASRCLNALSELLLEDTPKGSTGDISEITKMIRKIDPEQSFVPEIKIAYQDVLSGLKRRAQMLLRKTFKILIFISENKSLTEEERHQIKTLKLNMAALRHNTTDFWHSFETLLSQLKPFEDYFTEYAMTFNPEDSFSTPLSRRNSHDVVIRKASHSSEIEAARSRITAENLHQLDDNSLRISAPSTPNSQDRTGSLSSEGQGWLTEALKHYLEKQGFDFTKSRQLMSQFSNCISQVLENPEFDTEKTAALKEASKKFQKDIGILDENIQVWVKILKNLTHLEIRLGTSSQSLDSADEYGKTLVNKFKTLLTEYCQDKVSIKHFQDLFNGLIGCLEHNGQLFFQQLREQREVIENRQLDLEFSSEADEFDVQPHLDFEASFSRFSALSLDWERGASSNKTAELYRAIQEPEFKKRKESLMSTWQKILEKTENGQSWMEYLSRETKDKWIERLASDIEQLGITIDNALAPMLRLMVRWMELYPTISQINEVRFLEKKELLEDCLTETQRDNLRKLEGPIKDDPVLYLRELLAQKESAITAIELDDDVPEEIRKSTIDTPKTIPKRRGAHHIIPVNPNQLGEETHTQKHHGKSSITPKKEIQVLG